jgi:hypothetical protein
MLPALAQEAKDSTDRKFHEELLNHFVGKWKLTGVVNGEPANVTLEGNWVMNHQWLLINEKGSNIIPGMNTPYEGAFYIGYSESRHRYVRYLMNIFGADDPGNQVFTGMRMGNEIRLVSKDAGGLEHIEQFVWEPGSESWHIISKTKKNGKEAVPYLDMKAIIVN